MSSPGRGEGDRCKPVVNRQSPCAGSEHRPHSVATHLSFWVGYLASQSLSCSAYLWNDGSMD